LQIGKRRPVAAEAASRRDFLSLMGFSVTAASVAACRAPVQHAIPLPVASDQLVPGVANHYATTCGGCGAGCPLLVKQRDGRPIKIEGNERSRWTGGGTCASGQATVLSLYDDQRLHGPVLRGRPVSWKEMDDAVVRALAGGRADRKKVVLLSGTINSPSTRALIARWRERQPRFQHVTYQPVSASALREATRRTFGVAVVPHHDFAAARVIVGLEADFLGTWLSPVEFSRAYARGRRDDGGRSWHVQFESGVSVTGSNADLRIPVAPSALGLVALALLERVARKAGVSGGPPAANPGAVAGAHLDAVADRLWRNRERSLVVSGSQDVALQTVVAALNVLLDNVGRTVDPARPSWQDQGDDAAMATLVDELNRGQVHALIIWGANPVYDHADPNAFLAGLGKVALSISLADRPDETSAQVAALCPGHHFLEAWGDAEPIEGWFSLRQPLIAPLFDTRAPEESLRAWLEPGPGRAPDHRAELRRFWREQLFVRQQEATSFDDFWDRSLEAGVVELGPGASRSRSPVLARPDWKLAARRILDEARAAEAGPDHLELHLYRSVALGDGRHANNPWLQELPDPIAKLTWGNFAAISPRLAAERGLSAGDVVALQTERGEIALPVFIQPGQQERTVSVAVGYGRTQAGKAGEGVGANAFPLAGWAGPFRRFWTPLLALVNTGRREALAASQTHFSMEDRAIALETTPAALAAAATEAEPLPSLWAEQPQGAHRWGMAIDLDACTGCSACVVACQAENNVPVVGKDQVRRQRIMHWLRIDRYVGGPDESPAVFHQPMMCQHCGHAPCETVCPVLATTTSSDGINQQVYNRCIGTRYCANNCPYKVRRFNWHNYTQNADFDFNMNSTLGRLVLNPDVAVRSRGVMEKCSLCVQRIQLAKNQSLQGQRALGDGDIQTACQQSCPTQAIVFGDLQDPASRVSQLLRGRRAYRLLEELGTRPNVGYLKKVRRGEEPT
jgi:molybdopterin-containing oxidoreductase family iron-sulfur binding subunit